MRRTISIFGGLFLATQLFAQQSDQPASKASSGAQGQSQKQKGDSLRDGRLDQAPDAVKEQILRHAAGKQLQELSAHEWNGVTIYEAVFEGENSETRLRLAENGAPISMHIAGIETGGQIAEAAGARRDTETRPAPARQDDVTQPQAEQRATTQPHGVPDSIRKRMQEQLGEIQIEGVRPKIFYQLDIRHDGNLQQIWADDEGTLLRTQQSQQ
jgi:hypothetical protein